MAWITDPNFGSSLLAVPAASPFPTGGGNRMLNIWGGSGVVYRDDISVEDSEVSCQFFLTQNGISSGQDIGGLVTRRVADGSFYFTLFQQELSEDRLHLYRYNGVSDTFTLLAFSSTSHAAFNGITPLNIMDWTLRIQGESLSSNIFHADGTLALSVGVTDSLITGVGSPGIVGTLNIVVGNKVGEMYMDDWKVNNI